MIEKQGIAPDPSKRKVIRLYEDQRKRFVPYGIIPAIGLGLLFLYAFTAFAVSNIQATARSEGGQALVAMGADWAKLSVSGQHATLEGVAPSNAAKRAAEDAVRNAVNRTRTFGIRTRPIRGVNNKLTVASAPVTPVVEETDNAPSRHDFVYSLKDSVLELSGEVPDQETRIAITQAARTRLSPPRFTAVDDRLVVTGRNAGVGFQGAALRGVNTLSLCKSGLATLENSVFSLSCEAETGVVDEINALGRTPLTFGRVGRIDAYAAEQVDACNQSLLNLLSTAKIEFATNSAVINSTSAALLDRIASAAKTCPGTLAINGHTDSSGRALLNNRLSLRRAEAVRRALIDRGVLAERLQAEGFGSNRPIADNTTREGRARNRRIEIKVAPRGT